MTILITGAQGFVGNHLIKALSKNTIYALCQKMSKLPKGAFPRNIKWIEGDLRKPKQMALLIQKIKPDQVYHLAAQASVPYSWQHPSKTFEINVLGTLYLLEALMTLEKPCTFLVVGSGEVYGRGNHLNEKSPLAPQNPYAASKAAQDLSLYPHLNQNSKIKIIRVRPFNHIGPGQDTRFVVPHFAYQIAAIEAKQMPPEIHVGNLKPKRDFTDVRDVVKAYKLLAQKGKSGEIYNICSGKLVSIESILNKLLSFSKEKIDIKIDPKFCRKNDILSIASSSKKLKLATGWKPTISLEKSLKDSLNFFRKELKKQ